MIKVKNWELDMSNKNSSIEFLESNLNVNELEKVRLEDEIKEKKSLGNIKKEEEEKFQQLMIENSVLKCEKKAESEVDAWKEKCNELEACELELQKEMQLVKIKKGIDILEIDSANMNEVNDDKDGSGVPQMGTLSKCCINSELGNQSGLESRDRKHIDLTTKGGQHRNVSPLASGIRPSVDVADISDSDDNLNLLKTRKTKVTSRVATDSDDPVDINDTDDNQNRSMVKKKRVTNRVTGDSHDPVDISDSDDNQNRSKIKKKRFTNRVTTDSDDPVDPVDISDSDDNQNRSMIKKKRFTNRVTSDSDDPVDPVDISDSDDNQIRSKIKKKRFTNRVTSDSDDPVDPVDISNSDDNQNRSKIKKKRFSNRVTSDSESDDPADTSDNLNPSKARKRKITNGVIYDSESDDDAPLSKLRSTNLPACNVDTELTNSTNDSFDNNLNTGTRGRRLNKLGKNRCEISKFMNDVDDDNEKDEDDPETGNLNGFIVHGSDASEDHSTSDSKEISENDGTSSGESQNESENSMSYDEIMSNLRREKKQKVVWEYQADILAEFGKHSELCMSAVCAMCRHHKKNGQYEGQGFNMYDGKICNELALIMTNGHPDGEVKKTAEELQKKKPRGIQLCRKYTTKYSGQ